MLSPRLIAVCIGLAEVLTVAFRILIDVQLAVVVLVAVRQQRAIGRQDNRLPIKQRGLAIQVLDCGNQRLQLVGYDFVSW